MLCEHPPRLRTSSETEVLILVVMEYALRALDITDKIMSKDVLILVVMEYALRVSCETQGCKSPTVLILVVMEYALRGGTSHRHKRSM